MKKGLNGTVELVSPKTDFLCNPSKIAVKLSKILDSRSDNCHREINQATERNIDALREITLPTHQHNSYVPALTLQTSRDSKMVKALTTVAVIFLPASLVAVRLHY